MGFTKVNNCWTTYGEDGGAGNNDAKVSPNGTNQEDDETNTTKPMDMVPYKLLEDKGPI